MPLKILIAPDSFKGSLTADEAAAAIRAGFLRVWPRAEYRRLPLADGGEGTLSALFAARGGRRFRLEVRGPRGRPVRTVCGRLPDASGVVEIASAGGLPLLAASERNPLLASSYGNGQVVRFLLDRNVSGLLVGLGGSATVDGGLGMLTALGARFLDGRGRRLSGAGRDLERVRAIDLSGLDRRLRGLPVTALCDVDNPLLGVRGAARVFGPQKGAGPAMVERLEAGLANFAARIRSELGFDGRRRPGAGAAGGLGFGLAACLGARLVNGADFIMEALGLERALEWSDLAVSGEGRVDGQVKFGKTLHRVGRLARKTGRPLLVLCGERALAERERHRLGFTAVFAIEPGPVTGAEAMARARLYLADTAAEAARLMAGFPGRLARG